LTAVERRTLIPSLKPTGTVAYGNKQTLRFNQKGTVAKVHFKDGDMRGDLLRHASCLYRGKTAADRSIAI